MLKVLHSALMVYPSAGIINQMGWEQKAADKLGLTWSTKIFCAFIPQRSNSLFARWPKADLTLGNSLLQRIINYVQFRRAYYSWLQEQSADFDVLILRYSTSDPLQYLFVRNSKRPIFFVHHTQEIPELRAIGGGGANFRVLLEQLVGGLSQRKSRGLIGVTEELVQFHLSNLNSQKAAFCYANGIHGDELKLSHLVRAERNKTSPQILFVASFFSPWHGLDLLLKSVIQSSSDFVLHLVGELSPEDLEAAGRDSRVKLHGSLTSDQIGSLIKQVDIGLSSFALDRKAMKEACPLKTREYLIQGLPVYAGHPDIFPESCSFYRVGLPDIDSIIEFCAETSSLDRLTTAQSAKPYIEKTRLLEQLNNWIHRSV